MLLSCNGIFQATLFQGQGGVGFFLVPDLLRSSRSFCFFMHKHVSTQASRHSKKNCEKARDERGGLLKVLDGRHSTTESSC